MNYYFTCSYETTYVENQKNKKYHKNSSLHGFIKFGKGWLSINLIKMKKTNVFLDFFRNMIDALLKDSLTNQNYL